MARYSLGHVLAALVLVAFLAGGVGFFFGSKNSPSGGNVPDSSSVTTLIPVAADADETRRAETAFHAEVPDSQRLNLSNMYILDPYAVADWSDENIGGMVIFARDENRSWTIITMDGGVLDTQTVINAGVPAGIAEKLLMVDRYP